MPAIAARSTTSTATGAAWTALVISSLVAAQGAFLVVLGFDEANFASAAGIDWNEFAAANPAAAAVMAEGSDGRLFGVTTLGLALVTAALIRRAMTRKGSTATWILWVLPLVLVGWAAVLLPTANAGIGGGSLVLAVLLGGALWLARPLFAS